MGSIWGENLKISLFGESHGRGIGVVLDGLPAGIALDEARIAAFMARRAPGRASHTTARREADEPEILSGFYQGRTTGTPLAAVIRNTDTRSADYAELLEKPRPGHADLTGAIRYGGAQDPRGGGHFSGRLTAPLTFAGAVASQILAERGIRIAAHLYEVAGIRDLPFDAVTSSTAQIDQLQTRDFPVLNPELETSMVAAIMAAKEKLDSVGGIVECIVRGLPAGLGDPMFGGVEPRFASLLFAIPAVKGVEFGSGFAAARSYGSENNDSPQFIDGQIRTRTNNSGGADGGITSGMPLLCRVAFKPTASIGREQDTVNLRTCQNERLVIHGRHDPSIVVRAVPVVEAAAAIASLDLLIGDRSVY